MTATTATPIQRMAYAQNPALQNNIFRCSKWHYFAPTGSGIIIMKTNSLTGAILWGCSAVWVNLD